MKKTEITKENYYTSSWKKVFDFIIGFFGTDLAIIALAVIYFTGFLFLIKSSSSFLNVNILLGSLIFIISIIALIIAFIIYFFKIGRKFIAIGIMCSQIPDVLFILLAISRFSLYGMRTLH